MKFEDVLTLLPRLNNDQLQELKAKVDFFLGGQRVDLPKSWLWLGIIHELRRRGVPVPEGPAVPQVRIKMFRRHEVDVAQRFEKLFPNMSKTETVVLGQLVAECLAAYMESWQKPPPISLEKLVMNYDKALEAFEWCFPDYIEAGWARFILSTRRRPAPNDN